MLSKQQHKENLRAFRQKTADQLKGLRIQNGLSLEQLSEQARIPLSVLIRSEQGMIHLPGLFWLVQFYGKKIEMVWIP